MKIKMKMTKEEVINEYGLCAVCAERETCEDRPDDMALSCCSGYSDDGGTVYEVTRRSRGNGKR